MKKSVVFLVLAILLVLPLVQSEEQTQEQIQEQAQEYSGFNRFVDNVKMFFSGGDNKVMLALEIREKEINSAIINSKNGEDEKAEKNLERARKRLQYVQEKVSFEIADEVRIDIDETIDRINDEGDLSDSFDVYVLEEEKTGLTAELIIEIDGKEGQILTREVVKDSETGQKKVDINIEGDDEGRVIEGEVEGQIQEQTKTREFEGETEGRLQEQTRTIEIETRMNEIDDAIADIIVKDNVVEDKLISGGSNGGDNVVDNDVLPGPDGIVGYQEPGDSGSDDVGDENPSEDGTNDVAPAVDSNEGD